MCVKEKNAGKLSSHAWLLSGLASLLDPQFVVLLDVGTAPREGALAELVGHMQDDPDCGGCCGEIAVRGARLWKPTDAAQMFEYGAAVRGARRCRSPHHGRLPSPTARPHSGARSCS